MFAVLAIGLGVATLAVSALQAAHAHPEAGDPGRNRARFTVPAAIGFGLIVAGVMVGAVDLVT